MGYCPMMEWGSRRSHECPCCPRFHVSAEDRVWAKVGIDLEKNKKRVMKDPMLTRMFEMLVDQERRLMER